MNHHHDPQLLWKQEVSPSVRKSRRRRRRRNHKVEPTGREKMIGAAVLIASGIYVCFLWKVQTFLDKLEAGENFRMEALLRKAIERSSWRMSGRNNSTEGGLRLKDEIRGARGRREDQRFHAVKEEDTDAMDVADSRKKRTGRPKRYILFQGFMSGQGTGNVINGLL